MEESPKPTIRNHAFGVRAEAPVLTSPASSQCVDWYAEGESRIVRVGEVEVIVRFVGRKGRRGRIVITAPAGARFVHH